MPVIAVSPTYLTPQQIAGELQVDEDTVVQWAKRGIPRPGQPRVFLRAVKAGRRWRIARADLEEFLKLLTPNYQQGEEDRKARSRQASAATRRLHKVLGMT